MRIFAHMKLKRIIHGVALVLGLSVVGLLFYYTLWLITDEEMREAFSKGWPWNSWMVLVDYAACRRNLSRSLSAFSRDRQ